MSLSLQRDLTWRLLLCFLLLWSAIGATWYLVVRRAWTAEWDAELAWLAKEACYLLPEGGRLPPLAPSVEALGFSDPESGLYFEIWDADQVFSDRSPSLGRRSLPLPASFPRVATAGDARLPDGESLRMLAQEVLVPLPAPRTAPARFNVAVARNRAALDLRLRHLVMQIGAAVAGGVLITMLFIRLSVRKALRPLRKLEREIEALGADALDQRLDLTGVPKEVQPMVRRLNDLLRRLAESFERESRFTSDVAHELRTPVAELTALAEVRATWPDRASPGDDQEFLRIGRHLKRQIEALLTLARLEKGQGPVAREPVNLIDLIATQWQSLAAEAAARRLQVDLPEPPAPAVEGDPDLFAVIVRNLLENAVAYTPAGGDLRVAVRRSAGDPILAIDNRVEDPRALDTHAMFDRFWRADGARSDGGHCGLGLTLCRTSAAAMGMELLAEVDARTDRLAIRLLESTGRTEPTG